MYVVPELNTLLDPHECMYICVYIRTYVSMWTVMTHCAVHRMHMQYHSVNASKDMDRVPSPYPSHASI